MKNRQTIIKKVIFLTFILLLLPKNTYAYLDPGTGSYLLQIIAAGLFATLFLFKNWWKKIQEFFVKIFRRILFPRKVSPKHDEKDSKKTLTKDN